MNFLVFEETKFNHELSVFMLEVIKEDEFLLVSGK